MTNSVLCFIVSIKNDFPVSSHILFSQKVCERSFSVYPVLLISSSVQSKWLLQSVWDFSRDMPLCIVALHFSTGVSSQAPERDSLMDSCTLTQRNSLPRLLSFSGLQPYKYTISSFHMKEIIEFRDFEKLDMRVGKIMYVEDVPRTKKLYKIKVDLKDRQIQIISSLKGYYTKEELEGKLIVVLTNLKSTTFSGEKSEGMLLCAEHGSQCILLTPEKPIELGARIT